MRCKQERVGRCRLSAWWQMCKVAGVVRCVLVTFMWLASTSNIDLMLAVALHMVTLRLGRSPAALVSRTAASPVRLHAVGCGLRLHGVRRCRSAAHLTFNFPGLGVAVCVGRRRSACSGCANTYQKQSIPIGAGDQVMQTDQSRSMAAAEGVRHR